MSSVGRLQSIFYSYTRVEFNYIFFSGIVDSVLKADDLNESGYISYVEFAKARKTERMQAEQHQNTEL